jgi:hypothetical protein
MFSIMADTEVDALAPLTVSAKTKLPLQQAGNTKNALLTQSKV